MTSRVNLHPTRGVFGHGEKKVSPHPPRGANITVHEIPRSRGLESAADHSRPKRVFNESVEREGQLSKANLAKANAPIPTPIWHIPGLDDAPRNNIGQQMAPDARTKIELGESRIAATADVNDWANPLHARAAPNVPEYDPWARIAERLAEHNAAAALGDERAAATPMGRHRAAAHRVLQRLAQRDARFVTQSRRAAAIPMGAAPAGTPLPPRRSARTAAAATLAAMATAAAPPGPSSSAPSPSGSTAAAAAALGELRGAAEAASPTGSTSSASVPSRELNFERINRRLTDMSASTINSIIDAGYWMDAGNGFRHPNVSHRVANQQVLDYVRDMKPAS